MANPCMDTIGCDWIEKYPPIREPFRLKTYLIMKRLFDLSVVLVSAPFWLPIILLIAVAMKITEPDSPVFFFQLRTGKGGRRFKMYKFRTMVKNAEELKKKYMHLNELTWPDFKITNDPRITKIGRILRKTSLDELPQVINILLGDMSLVGPRPTSFSADTYRLWQTERLDVTPGITGLWQITGRGKSEFNERLRIDIAYIERRCFMMDLEILVRTFTSVLQQRGAV